MKSRHICACFSLLPYDNKIKCQNDHQLQNEDERNANVESGMLGFVVEDLHAGYYTDASTDHSDTQKHCLRYSPPSFLCFLFVDEHKQKPGCIDYNQINNYGEEYNLFHKKSFLEGCVMKKCLACLLLMLLLTGCGKQETMETVNDEYVQPVAADMQQVLVELPKEAVAPVMETDTGKLYICDNYTISQQIFDSGDLEETIQNISGFSKNDLKIMETQWDNAKRYDFVWTAAGETEEQVCRACILDDGSYHYVLTAAAGATYSGQLQQAWREMFNSFRLVSPEMPLGTGS